MYMLNVRIINITWRIFSSIAEIKIKLLNLYTNTHPEILHFICDTLSVHFSLLRRSPVWTLHKAACFGETFYFHLQGHSLKHWMPSYSSSRPTVRL